MTNDVIAAIDAEIATLRKVRALLATTGKAGKASTGTTVTEGNNPTGRKPHKKRVLSPEARAKIVAAVKRRWAKQKKAAK